MLGAFDLPDSYGPNVPGPRALPRSKSPSSGAAAFRLEVILTLGALIDAAWPDSQLVLNEDKYTNQVIYRIDNATRQTIDGGDAAALLVEPADDIEITSLGPEGVGMLTPADVGPNLLPAIKAAFEEFPDAENYRNPPRI